jgi:cytochrome bd ubiquinol oxidase subunit I
LFVLVYGIVFAMGIYYINRLIVRGPDEVAREPHNGGPLARWSPPSAIEGAGEPPVEQTRRVSRPREFIE